LLGVFPYGESATPGESHYHLVPEIYKRHSRPEGEYRQQGGMVARPRHEQEVDGRPADDEEDEEESLAVAEGEPERSAGERGGQYDVVVAVGKPRPPLLSRGRYIDGRLF
jgi:hypothetical protein